MEKKINITYHVKVKPEWLVRYVMQIRELYPLATETSIDYTLKKLSLYLNTFYYFYRKLKSSCGFIRREIQDNSLCIYNTTNTKIIVTINYL